MSDWYKVGVVVVGAAVVVVPGPAVVVVGPAAVVVGPPHEVAQARGNRNAPKHGPVFP